MALTLAVLAPPRTAAELEDAQARLERALQRLAQQAQTHNSLLYRIQCDENASRVVHRSLESAAGFGFQPDQMLEQHNGILVVQDGSGAPQEKRVRLDREGHVRLTKKGQPVEAQLPAEFEPVAGAFPHAQVAWFSAENQPKLKIGLLEDGAPAEGRFRIECLDPHDLALEFLDRDVPLRSGPKSEPRCTSRASGQMCLGDDGEIRRLQFYGTYFDGEVCRWDRSTPFATIEQQLVETTTGLRFPSRVTTMLSLSWRDTAIFIQRYENCVFADIHVKASLGKKVSDSN